MPDVGGLSDEDICSLLRITDTSRLSAEFFPCARDALQDIPKNLSTENIGKLSLCVTYLMYCSDADEWQLESKIAACLTELLGLQNTAHDYKVRVLNAIAYAKSREWYQSEERWSDNVPYVRLSVLGRKILEQLYAVPNTSAMPVERPSEEILHAPVVADMAAMSSTLDGSEGIRVYGVSMLDAASLFDGDPDLAMAMVDRWQKTRTPKPESIGFAPEHAQIKLYAPPAMLKYVKENETKLPMSEAAFRSALEAKKRAPRPEKQPPA